MKSDATKRYESLVKADIHAVWEFHSSAEALRTLTPPNRNVKLLSSDLSVHEGAIHAFQVRVGPFRITWRAQLSAVDSPHGFLDTAVQSPFRTWTHKHEFIAHPDGTLIRDSIEYEVPFGILGAVANRLFVSKEIDRLFAFRHRATAKALEGDGSIHNHRALMKNLMKTPQL